MKSSLARVTITAILGGAGDVEGVSFDPTVIGQNLSQFVQNNLSVGAVAVGTAAVAGVSFNSLRRIFATEQMQQELIEEATISDDPNNIKIQSLVEEVAQDRQECEMTDEIQSIDAPLQRTEEDLSQADAQPHEDTSIDSHSISEVMPVALSQTNNSSDTSETAKQSKAGEFEHQEMAQRITTTKPSGRKLQKVAAAALALASSSSLVGCGTTQSLILASHFSASTDPISKLPSANVALETQYFGSADWATEQLERFQGILRKLSSLARHGGFSDEFIQRLFDDLNMHESDIRDFTQHHKGMKEKIQLEVSNLTKQLNEFDHSHLCARKFNFYVENYNSWMQHLSGRQDFVISERPYSEQVILSNMQRLLGKLVHLAKGGMTKQCLDTLKEDLRRDGADILDFVKHNKGMRDEIESELSKLKNTLKTFEAENTATDSDFIKISILYRLNVTNQIYNEIVNRIFPGKDLESSNPWEKLYNERVAAETKQCTQLRNGEISAEEVKNLLNPEEEKFNIHGVLERLDNFDRCLGKDHQEFIIKKLEEKKWKIFDDLKTYENKASAVGSILAAQEARIAYNSAVESVDWWNTPGSCFHNSAKDCYNDELNKRSSGGAFTARKTLYEASQHIVKGLLKPDPVVV